MLVPSDNEVNVTDLSALVTSVEVLTITSLTIDGSAIQRLIGTTAEIFSNIDVISQADIIPFDW